MQPSRWVVERQAYIQTGQIRRLNRPPPHVASYSSFTVPRDETMPPCCMTGSHRHPSWRQHRPISLSPTSETDLSQEHSFNRRECGGGRGERRVVNNRCETMCTSRRRLLLDNAATRWRWGRGEHGILSSRQSAITPTSQ